MGWYGGNSDYKTGIDIGESAANKVKNIYDMAGNVKEWTLEYTSISSAPCTVRGGSYDNYGFNNAASIHGRCIKNEANIRYGFRVVLY